MKRKIENVPTVIPPALDTEETQLLARNEFIVKNDVLGNQEFETLEEILPNEIQDDFLDETDDALIAKDQERTKVAVRSKFRKSMTFFSIFIAAFGILLAVLAWAFGFGFFSQGARVSVDRSQKRSDAQPVAATNSEEKLKTALAIVANETENNQSPQITTENSTSPTSIKEQDLKLNSAGESSSSSDKAKKQSSGNMIELPDEAANPQSNQTSRPDQPASPGSTNLRKTAPASENRTVPNSNLESPSVNQTNQNNYTDKAGGAIARSVFFGRISPERRSSEIGSSKELPKIVTNLSPTISSSPIEKVNLPAFGTLLPVRFLGAVFTLTGSGGIVRMELTRAITRSGFTAPAGTIIVGRLRGNDYNRAFVSIIGAVDSRSGKLIKFEGEVLGTDGASGVIGERKSVKSWGSKFLSALREVGGDAVNVITSRTGRAGGGSIILSSGSGIGREVSSVVRGSPESDSFVKVNAGTEAYVLITNLPNDQRSDETARKFAENQYKVPGLNISESELSDLVTTSDPDKIRAWASKLPAELRQAAFQAMEEQ